MHSDDKQGEVVMYAIAIPRKPDGGRKCKQGRLLFPLDGIAAGQQWSQPIPPAKHPRDLSRFDLENARIVAIGARNRVRQLKPAEYADMRETFDAKLKLVHDMHSSFAKSATPKPAHTSAVS